MSESTQAVNNIRLAALRFHSLTKADQRWLLRQLQPSEKRSLLAAYRRLKTVKGFRDLSFEDVYNALNQIENDQIPILEGDDEAAKINAVNAAREERLASLPIELQAVMQANQLLPEVHQLIAQRQPSVQRKLAQLQNLVTGNMTPTAKKCLTGLFERSGTRNG